MHTDVVSYSLAAHTPSHKRHNYQKVSVGAVSQVELKALCSKESSILYQKTNEALNQFLWDQLVSELESKALVLFVYFESFYEY